MHGNRTAERRHAGRAAALLAALALLSSACTGEPAGPTAADNIGGFPRGQPATELPIDAEWLNTVEPPTLAKRAVGDPHSRRIRSVAPASRCARQRQTIRNAEPVALAIQRLRQLLDQTYVGFAFLSEEFTLLDLQRVHEAILGQSVNKASFRRRMLTTGILEATGHHEEDVDHRPAELYRVRH